ncbi:hypothetical protein MLD38_005627 [Melastoma candidum]|uniref:Uncharacterized protein n=1 Tax=Melastoma candidum TaxID=119954 RepID=A0ACB9RNA5_9MYRT|nr:hypothetical protein MLD38_005627 [Melastoma candidum]
MGNLKVLEIYESSMTATPNLSWCLKLEILILKSCDELQTVHASIGKLQDLISLNISMCPSLRSLPEELGNAKALQELVVMYCGTHRCRFSLPKSIGKLTSLSRLFIIESPMTEVPDAFAEMRSLEYLHLRHCRVGNLPNSVWGLNLLIEVDLWHTDIQELPESIGSLVNLRVLRVKGTKVRKLPTSIMKLKKLEELDAAGCPLNWGIPDEIGRLSALTKLDLSSSKIRQLPATISQLSSLQSLYLNSCNLIQTLPELPDSLTKLELTSKSLRLVPRLSLLTNLTELLISDGGVPNRHARSQSPPLQLSCIGKLHKLKNLSLHLTRIPALLSTELGSLPRLEVLQISCRNMESIVHLPASLSRLSFSYVRTAMPWTRYANLRFLYSLDLHLSTLTKIILGGLDKLENLKDLRIRNCSRLEMLSDLECLRRISYLRLEQCPVLVELSGLDRMELLEELSILHCGSIRGIPNLSELRRMKKVKIWWCESLACMPLTISECHLSIHMCKALPEYNSIHPQDKRREGASQLVRRCFSHASS